MKLTTPIAELINEELSRLEVGTARTFAGLTVFPILGGGPDAGADPGYLTLDRALEAGTVRISEVSEGGSVPELRLENLGDQPVLLVDGEELAGAKQNRVVNLTILAPPKSTITIPVSCVEAGRWSSVGRHFSSEDHVMHSKGRSAKLAQVTRSLKFRGSYRSDQGAVWAEVEQARRAHSVDSPTSRLADVYRAKRREMDDFVRELTPVDGQVGVAFALGGKVRGVELFDRQRTLRDLHGKLVRSWALDALARGDGAQKIPGAEKVEKFLGKIRAAAADASAVGREALGLGSDVRLEGPRLVGSALVHDARMLHLCAFRTARRDDGTSGGDGDADGGSRRRGPGARLTQRFMSASRRLRRYEG